MQTYDVVVVGAGYVGCAVACSLAVAGVKTALLEQGSVPGGASLANYGSIQIQDAELSHSLPMVTAGARGFERLEEELGSAVGYRPRPSLLVIENEAQWRLMAGRITVLQHAGIQAELLPAERLGEVEPLLDRRAILGACYHPDEGQISPFSLLAAFLRRGRQAGLEVYPNTAVTGFDIAGGRLQGVRTSSVPFGAAHVVLTTGAWTPALGRALGRRWAIPHVHGQALVTEASELQLNCHLSSAAFFEEMGADQDSPAIGGDALSAAAGTGGTAAPRAVLAVAQTEHGHFLLGEAGRVTEDLGKQATWQGQAAVAAEVARFLPALSRLRVLRGWAAPVAYTDDGLPFLGPVADLPGLLLATAFKSTVVVTPWIGRVIVDLVSRGRAALPDWPGLAAFSPDRFVGNPGVQQP